MMKTRGSVTGGRKEVGEEEVAGVKQRTAGEPRETGGGERGFRRVHVYALGLRLNLIRSSSISSGILRTEEVAVVAAWQEFY